jgi:hypothetical protein
MKRKERWCSNVRKERIGEEREGKGVQKKNGRRSMKRRK